MNHASKFLLAPWSYGQSHRGVSLAPRQIWNTWNKTYPGVVEVKKYFLDHSIRNILLGRKPDYT